jgi:hypothetical protein
VQLIVQLFGKIGPLTLQFKVILVWRCALEFLLNEQFFSFQALDLLLQTLNNFFILAGLRLLEFYCVIRLH